jgi:fumarate reductase flavoprotein subunit
MARDVVIAGAGLAGWAAAVAALEEGARVTLLEKTARAGGSTVLSGGFLALAGTAMQRALGIEDRPELLEVDLLAVGEGENDRALVHAYAAGQADMLDWLEQRGLQLLDVELSSGQSVARSHRCVPADLVSALRARAEALGVEFHVDAPVEELVVRDRTVIGVRANGREHHGAVILATGGFSRSEELLAELAPSQVHALRLGGEGSTGDGLRMAMGIGAGARDFAFVRGTFGTPPTDDPTEHKLLLAYYLGAIIVNADGRRFVDESVSYKLIGDACLQQPGHRAFQIFDHALLQAAPRDVPLFDPRPLLEEGLLRSAPSLEDLAEAIDVDRAALLDTVTSYNRVVAQGGDALGRRNLVASAGALVPIQQGPFYAYPSTTAVLATYCGLTVDVDARVLDGSGAPIPGLWAAGEITGGFHGAAYMTGSSLGKAAYFGRAAGRGAARNSSEERA